MSADSGIGAQGFISYTRDDNTDFAGVVDRLKSEIEGRFHAATGRKLEIFLDRESIGWGADWRKKIRASVKSATFFIPIITMRYFESDACREELLAFYENAKQLGVTDLILPVVLTGADGIKDDDPRDEVRLIESLNYKNIEDAWLAGYESSDWLQAVNAMIKELKAGLSIAESALVSQEAEIVVVVEEVESEELPDAVALNEEVGSLTPAIERALAATTAFGDAAGASLDGVDLASMSPKQQQVTLIGVARSLLQPAEDLADSGAALEKTVAQTDAHLRSVIDELRTIDADLARDGLGTMLAAMSGLGELKNVPEQLNGLVQVLRFAALTNVSLRRSVQPAIQGIQSISNAVSTVESWSSI